MGREICRKKKKRLELIDEDKDKDKEVMPEKKNLGRCREDG